MGVEYRRWRLIRNLADDFLGDYNTTGATVLSNNINCPTVTCGTGNETADMLLGYYSSAATSQPGAVESHNNSRQSPDACLHVFRAVFRR